MFQGGGKVTNSAGSSAKMLCTAGSVHNTDVDKKRPPKRCRESGVVDKASKGLRQLSLRVCQKVEHKGETTYGEVADELVNEILGESLEVCVEDYYMLYCVDLGRAVI